MKKVFFALCLFTVSAFAGDLTHLDEIEKGKDKVVFGQPLKAADLKGKVILFKYWGYN